MCAIHRNRRAPRGLFRTVAREGGSNEATPVHQAVWRRGFGAAPGARAAAGTSSQQIGLLVDPRLRPGACMAAFVRRLRELGWIEGRPSQSSIAGRKVATSASPKSRPSLSGSRSMSLSRREVQSLRQSRRHRSSRSSSRWQRTQWAADWSPVWRNPAATLPACQLSLPILPASDSNSCARSCPVFASWRSWLMLAIPPPCWRWPRFRQRPARSASRSPLGNPASRGYRARL